MDGYRITGQDASFVYNKIYGFPDDVQPVNVQFLPTYVQDDSPEYISVGTPPNNIPYRLYVGIDYDECSFLVEFIDSNGITVSGMYPEMTVVGFVRIVREGFGYRIWCDRNRTKMDRTLSLWFRGDNDPYLRFEIPILQKAEVFAISVPEEYRTIGIVSLLSQDSPIQSPIEIPVSCLGGKKRFKVSSVRVKMFYGEEVDIDDPMQIEEIDPYSMSEQEKDAFYNCDKGKPWKYSFPKYAMFSEDGPYFLHYFYEDSDDSSDDSSDSISSSSESGIHYGYVRCDMGIDPATEKLRAYRIIKTDNAISASVGENNTLKIENHGRLFKSVNKTPSYLYEITLSHVDDGTKKAVINVYYNDL